jgi:hypothetical protein
MRLKGIATPRVAVYAIVTGSDKLAKVAVWRARSRKLAPSSPHAGVLLKFSLAQVQTLQKSERHI